MPEPSPSSDCGSCCNPFDTCRENCFREDTAGRQESGPYTLALDKGDRGWYARGPGNGHGYDSGYLYPTTRLKSKGIACSVVDMMNEAYRQGEEAALRRVRAALGLKS